MSRITSDVRLEALLAEYAAVNTVVERKTTLITTLITFQATAIATVVGFIVSEKADVRLLLVIPIISAIVGLLISSQDFDIRTAEDHVRAVLQPILMEYCGDDRLWRWHDQLLTRRRAVFVGLTRLAPLGLLFPGAAVGSLIFTAARLRNGLDWLAWVLGLMLTALLLTGWSHALVALTGGQSQRFRRPRPAGGGGAGSGEVG
ncbi:hypothetical protein [Micromonospora sp. NPDC005806]|uniref:hypothetical protein n=1 Tax=Micromonospora sp. NPDC005806 TaxID=3364234 RepID=UPI003682E7EE